MPSEALVSAIMPTRARREWAAQAVRMFNEQTWPWKELVIVDDIDERSFLDVPDVPGVRYHLLEHRLTIGEKRNLAIEFASGDIICHWDSDDRYRADRIEHQIQVLLRSGADIAGYHEMEFVDVDSAERWMYSASVGRPIGVSMMYRRAVWQERSFQAINVQEDVNFAAGRRIHCCPAEGRIVARVHGGNTSEKRGPIQRNPAQWSKIA